MDNCTSGIYGGVHASANFCVIDSNVSKAAIEFNKELGMWYVTGTGFDLVFQVRV